jgi:hypothetical protein
MTVGVSQYLSRSRFVFRYSTIVQEDELEPIVRQLQETLSELQETKNREIRLTLLRHMRLLLLEGDRVLDETQTKSS